MASCLLRYSSVRRFGPHDQALGHVDIPDFAAFADNRWILSHTCNSQQHNSFLSEACDREDGTVLQEIGHPEWEIMSCL